MVVSVAPSFPRQSARARSSVRAAGARPLAFSASTCQERATVDGSVSGSQPHAHSPCAVATVTFSTHSLALGVVKQAEAVAADPSARWLSNCDARVWACEAKVRWCGQLGTRSPTQHNAGRPTVQRSRHRDSGIGSVAAGLEDPHADLAGQWLRQAMVRARSATCAGTTTTWSGWEQPVRAHVASNRNAARARDVPGRTPPCRACRTPESGATRSAESGIRHRTRPRLQRAHQRLLRRPRQLRLLQPHARLMKLPW